MAEGVYIFNMLDTSFLSGEDTVNGSTAKYFMKFIFQPLVCCYNVEYWNDGLNKKLFFVNQKVFCMGKKSKFNIFTMEKTKK